MKHRRNVVFSVILCCASLVGCNFTPDSAPEPTPTQTSLPATELPVNTPTLLPSPTEEIVHVATAAPGTLVMDFVALMCSAQWSNSANFLPCPGDETTFELGYVGRLEAPVLNGGQVVDSPALLTIPTQEGTGRGMFGRYPPFLVQPGDVFNATLACEEGAQGCEVAFALHYYDETGTFQREPLGEWLFAVGEPGSDPIPLPVQVPLDDVVGQTVEFVLTVRDEGDPQGDHAVWILPHIQRDPDAPILTPPPTESAPLADVSPQAPTSSGSGVISGMVDMRSAPPYLNDPIATGGQGMPVVVVFFNLDDGTWWWIHTTPTHPNYQMTVTTGRYHVVAYAHGVGDVAYVTGAYTSKNPSCGEPMATVMVSRGQHVHGIEIADWNWSCGGTASRPDKPANIPIP
jgi:hypothetical protein